MRSLPPSNEPNDESEAGGSLGIGGGVQFLPVQHVPGGDDQEAIRFELLLSFARALIHNTVSSDALALSVYAAQDAVSASEEEMQKFMRVVLKEKDRYGIWPKGF